MATAQLTEREFLVLDMEKSVATLEKGTTFASWNYCGQRLATGSVDGTLSIFDSPDPASPSFTSISKTKVHEGGIAKIVWFPAEYGDAVACICGDGSLVLWEEVVEDAEPVKWKLCKRFQSQATKVLDAQFGVFQTSLKLGMHCICILLPVSPLFDFHKNMYIYPLFGQTKELLMLWHISDGHVKVYDLSDPLELKNWQLQAEFQNVIDSVSTFGRVSCFSTSIAWNPQKNKSQAPSFALGFNSGTPQLNSSKVWEFDQAHQRWLPVAELALPVDKSDGVLAIAWAPNIGRPYEVIADAINKGIGIWHLGLNPELDGRLPLERVALLSGYEGEVWQMDWDMGGMTLATTGTDGMVRLWQSDLNGVWHEQAAFEPTS